MKGYTNDKQYIQPDSAGDDFLGDLAGGIAEVLPALARSLPLLSDIQVAAACDLVDGELRDRFVQGRGGAYERERAYLRLQMAAAVDGEDG